MTVYVELRTRDAIFRVIAQRIDGRIIRNTITRQKVERPQSPFGHRKGGGAETANRYVHAPRKHCQRALKIATKCLGRNFRQEQVRVAVYRNLVSFRRNPAHQIGQPFRNPAQHKKRRTRVVLRKEIQESVRIFFYAQFQMRPICRCNHLAQIVRAKPIFQIHRQDILHSVPSRSSTRALIS